MAGGKGYTFSTDTEEDSNDWINAFNAALKKNQYSPENQQNDEVLDKGKPTPMAIYGLLTATRQHSNADGALF